MTTSDPNINEYGYDHSDWDDMSQNEQMDIAHEHGDDWHGQPPPAQDDDDSPSSSTPSTPPPVPEFKNDAEQEEWLAEQRQRQWDEQEKERQQNVEKGRKDWEQQTRDREERLREGGRHDAADRVKQDRESQRGRWNQEAADSEDDRERDRQAYIDRPDRDSLIQQAQADDSNAERRKMRDALAKAHPQSAASQIEHTIWYNWAWEDAPPPPSAARIAAASGPDAIPLFSESLDPMLKLGWESGEEYLERTAIVQAHRDQLSEERALRESREEQQFPWESDRDFEARRDAYRRGLSGPPRTATAYLVERLNEQGLGPAEYAAALESLSRDPYFHGASYDHQRQWLAGRADFYGLVSDAIAIGQLGTAEDLGDAISALQQMAERADITEGQRAYLGRVIDSHTEARAPLVETSEKANDAWVTKVLGNINAFGGPEALAQAKAVQNDGSLTREARWEAMAEIEAQSFVDAANRWNAEIHAREGEAWETKVVANISAIGGAEALARAQAVQDDGSLTPEQRQKALSDLETRVIDQAQAKYDREMQKARELAGPLGWDPDARGGRPELTPREYIEQHNEEVAAKNRDLAESLNWDPDARGGRPELTPREYIEQHNEEVEARARNRRESERQLEALDELEPERLAQETLQRQQAAQFREDMFAELRSRGVSDEELADLTPGQLDAALAATADDLTREYQEWRESQRQLEALDELEPERLAQETLQRQQAAQFREDMFAELRSRGVSDEELADLTPGQLDAALAATADDLTREYQEWRESQRQLEALDELEPERLAQETLQRQQAAQFREDMFAELRSRGVGDEELADLTPGQLDAALAATAADLTREYQEWRESQRQLEALDELEPERLAQETLQRQQAAQFREDMFAELRSRGVGDEELADLTPGQLDAALAATAADLTREYQEWRESQRQLEALDELEPERLAQEALQRSELHAAMQALFAHSGGDEIALDESEQAARAAALWQRPGDWPQALRDVYQAGGWAGLRGTLTDDEIDARKAALSAELYGEGVPPADWWDDRTGDLALDLPELGEAGIDASPGNIDNLSAGELDKATRIASGERLPAIRLQDAWGREIVLDPMEPFDRESYEVAAISARGDAALDRQVREYAQGYGMYRLELPDSEMNARRLRLLESLSYAAPLPGIALGGKFVTFAARPFAKGVSKGVSLLVRSGNKVPLSNVADDAAATVAKNAADFTRLLDTGKIGEARRVLLKNKTFRDWATGGGLDKADIQKAGMGHWLEEAVTLPPNVLQRALGNPVVNVAAQTLKSAVIGSGFSGAISTGIAVAPLGGQGWGEISGNEGKGIIDSLWQGGIGGATGGLSHRGVNAWRRGVRKEELGRVGGYKLSAIEGASTDTGLALVPGFEDPTFGRITRDETLGIGLSTVADPGLDGVKGVYRLLRHPRSLLPSTVSAGGLGSGTQKMHYSQVAAGDDVELREVTSLAEDGITPVATLQPEANIREEIERRLKDHPQRIRPGDESGLGYDRIMSEGLDPISGLRLKEEILDALARGETDIRGVTSSGIPYRFTPPAAYRTGVFDPGAAAHLSPNASFALRARGDAPDATYRSRSTNANSVEEVLYYQPGAMALRYFDTSAMGNTGADAARADRVDAGRVGADRVDADRVDTARADKPYLPRRKPREEHQEETEKRHLPLRFPKKVRFQTVEEVEVDLESGDTTRTPVGNSPATTLKVVEHGELPHTAQHYTGRITDVLTDDEGHPYVAQKTDYQGRRPRRLPTSSELAQKGESKIKQRLEEALARGGGQGSPSQARGRGRRGVKGGGKVTPAPGPSSTGRSPRRGMTALERTRLKNFAPR